MTRFSLLIAAAAVVGFAGFTQTSSPVYACASAVGGQTGLEASPAFEFNAGGGYYSPDGTTDTTPLFGRVGNISIGQDLSDTGAYNDDSVLVHQPATGGAQIVLAPCPDGAPD